MDINIPPLDELNDVLHILYEQRSQLYIKLYEPKITEDVELDKRIIKEIRIIDELIKTYIETCGYDSDIIYNNDEEHNATIYATNTGHSSKK